MMLSLAFLLLLTPSSLMAHSAPSGWEYIEPCCSESDCRMVVDDEVQQIFAGEKYTNLDGDKVQVREAGFVVRNRFIPARRALISPDDRYHICTSESPTSPVYNSSQWSEDFMLSRNYTEPHNFEYCRSGETNKPIETPSEEVKSMSFPPQDFHCIWVPVGACEAALEDRPLPPPKTPTQHQPQPPTSGRPDQSSPNKNLFPIIYFIDPTPRRSMDPKTDIPGVIHEPVSAVPLSSSVNFLSGGLIGGAVLVGAISWPVAIGAFAALGAANLLF